MKKLNTLLLSALALGITATSCTKDEAKPSIVAKWTLDKYTHTADGTTSAEAPYTDPTCTDKSYMDLKTTGVISEQILGDQNNPCVVAKYDGTYTYKDNTIHIVEGTDYTADYIVLSLTSTKMIAKIPVNEAGTEYYTVTFIK